MTKCIPVRLDDHTASQIDLLARHRQQPRSEIVRDIIAGAIREMEGAALGKLAPIEAFGRDGETRLDPEGTKAGNGSNHQGQGGTK